MEHIFLLLVCFVNHFGLVGWCRDQNGWFLVEFCFLYDSVLVCLNHFGSIDKPERGVV